jgi:hypothetical protein
MYKTILALVAVLLIAQVAASDDATHHATVKPGEIYKLSATSFKTVVSRHEFVLVTFYVRIFRDLVEVGASWLVVLASGFPCWHHRDILYHLIEMLTYCNTNPVRFENAPFCDVCRLLGASIPESCYQRYPK